MHPFMERSFSNDQQGMENACRAYFEKLEGAEEQLNQLLDAEFYSCSFEEKKLTLKAKPKPWMANPNGLMHGGITASYFDYAMGVLSIYMSGWRMTPTLHMDVNYMRPIKIGKPICIETRVMKAGNKITYLDAVMYPENMPDKLLASATGAYYLVPQE